MSGIFANEARRYREAGFWPRPVQLGSKACKIKGWQLPDPAIAEAELARWPAEYGGQGLALLMGNPLPDGTTGGAFDIDNDQYVRLVKAMLGNPVCGRIGSKGAVFFVRVQPGLKNRIFRVKDGGPQIGEALFARTLCVIPPTIHPDTGQPYRWIGPSLLDIDPLTLPLIGE